MNSRPPRQGAGLAPWRALLAALALVTIASVIGLSRELLRPAIAHESRGIPGALPGTAGRQPPRAMDAGDAVAAVPERVWTVTLVDELFPAPPTAEPLPPPPPPPALRLQLIAITGQGETRRVFVRDPGSDRYLNLSPGDSVSTGIVLAAIDQAGATFDVAGRHVRLELPK